MQNLADDTNISVASISRKVLCSLLRQAAMHDLLRDLLVVILMLGLRSTTMYATAQAGTTC